MRPGLDEVVIVVGSDDRYAIGVAVTLHSVLLSLSPGTSAHILVVDGGISADGRRRLQRVVDSSSSNAVVSWHSADPDRFQGLKVSKWGSTANYLRLLIPEIVSAGATKVVYLDSDLLIRADVGELVALADDDDAPVYAVGDFHHRYARTVFGADGCTEIGLDPQTPYFNSGVLVMNVDVWRREQIPRRAVDFVRRHASAMKHSDQDALNAVLAGRWKALPTEWNVMLPSLPRYVDQVLEPQARAGERRRLIDEAKVLHYTGARKPWLPGYVGPAGRPYRGALRRSGWFDGRGEALAWTAAYWLRSPRGWLREGYRRLRKRAALAYRRVRPEQARA